MSVCVCGDVSVCEALKLLCLSVSATAFESAIPAGSAGGYSNWGDASASG